MEKELIIKTGKILEELFNFDGQIEELCCMSEIEGDFDYTSDDMIETLHNFIKFSKI